MAQYVFISYARKDAEFALKLGRDLREKGVPIWLDQLDIPPGQRWDRAVEQALESCDHLLIILSPDSVASENVLDEVAVAFEHKKPIVPVLYRPCKVPLRLVRLQYIDFTRADYQSALGHLQAAFSGLVDWRLQEAESRERKEAEREAQEDAGSLAKVQKPSQGSSWLRRRPPLAWGGLLALLLLAGAIAVWPRGGGRGPTPTPTATVPVVAWQPTATYTPLRPAAPSTPKPPTATPTPLPTATPTPKPPTATPTSLPTATFTPKPPTATPTPQLPTPAPTLGVGSTLVREKDGMVMVYVPGGTFQMGSTQDTSMAQPVHTVTLDGFWIDRTEVTNAQYARCVAAGKCGAPSETSSYTRSSYYGDSQHNDYPVIYVSWNDATAYCVWAGGQLPTEAQWEYAARGPDGRVYPWGNDPPSDTLLNYNNNVDDTTKVGSYPDGASWSGALDMMGNVWEWVADWYGPYPPEPQVNPTGPSSGEYRVVRRGGGWGNYRDLARVAVRTRDGPDFRYFDIGFRCASGLP